MTTISLKVPNISCDHCVHTIKNELKELEGIQRVDANRDSKIVTVDFDPPASREKIEALLAEIEYPAEKLLSL
jgi:copper chaperone CopZ